MPSMNIFTNIGPNLANSIHDSDASLSNLLNLLSAESKFSRFQLISESKVVKLLNGLSNRKAAGLDKISGRILKIAANTILLHHLRISLIVV